MSSAGAAVRGKDICCRGLGPWEPPADGVVNPVMELEGDRCGLEDMESVWIAKLASSWAGLATELLGERPSEPNGPSARPGGAWGCACWPVGGTCSWYLSGEGVSMLKSSGSGSMTGEDVSSVPAVAETPDAAGETAAAAVGIRWGTVMAGVGVFGGVLSARVGAAAAALLLAGGLDMRA